jgi:hypothetical protein
MAAYVGRVSMARTAVREAGAGRVSGQEGPLGGGEALRGEEGGEGGADSGCLDRMGLGVGDVPVGARWQGALLLGLPLLGSDALPCAGGLVSRDGGEDFGGHAATGVGGVDGGSLHGDEGEGGADGAQVEQGGQVAHTPREAVLVPVRHGVGQAGT